MDMATPIPDISFLKRKDEPEIEILKVGNFQKRLDRLSPHPEKPHRVDFYIAVYITDGSGTHFIDFKPYRFENGSIILVSKGQAHAFDLSKVRDGFLVLFTDTFLSKNLIHSDMLALHKLYNYHLHRPVMTPEETKGLGLNPLFGEWLKEYERPDDFAREELLRLFLNIFLLKLQRFKQALLPSKINAAYIRTFTVFKNLIDRHFIETRNAGDYARMMQVSYKHLNSICKRITGDTPKQFIDKCVILEMKRYLATTGFSIKELTYELGFDEPTNFVKYFQRHTQTTPAKFKQALEE